MDQKSPLWREIEDVVQSACWAYGHPQAVDTVGDAVDQILRVVESAQEAERSAYMALIDPTPLVVVSDEEAEEFRQRWMAAVKTGRIEVLPAAGHDINSGGNCRAPGCRWFSDGDRRHNEPGEEPGEPRGSVWD